MSRWCVLAKKIKFMNSVLCEHAIPSAPLRKHTLVNVYSGDIIVAVLPAELTFGFYLEVAPPFPSKMQVELKMDGKVFAKLDASLPQDPHLKQSVLVLPLVQVGVDKDLTFEITGLAEGFIRTSFIRKRISQGAIPGYESPAAQAP